MTVRAQVTADEGTMLRVLTFKDFVTLTLDEDLTIVFNGESPDPVAKALDNIEMLGRRLINLVEVKRVQLYTGIIEDARAEQFWQEQQDSDFGKEYTDPANDDTAGMTYEESQQVPF